jgi:hypothetical protein
LAVLWLLFFEQCECPVLYKVVFEVEQGGAVAGAAWFSIPRQGECMFKVGQTTAKIAAWNLAGFGGISNERVERQIEGLALLDAEIVALVEINPLSVLSRFE